MWRRRGRGPVVSASASVACKVLAMAAGAMLAAAACAVPDPDPDPLQPRCRPDAVEQNRCRELEPSPPIFIFFIDGAKLTIQYENNESFSIVCSGNVTLDSDALPRFTTDRPVAPPEIKVQHCPVPAVASYSAALAALHVSVANVVHLKLLYLPPHSPLRPAHFRDLASTLARLTLFVDPEPPALPLPPPREALFANLPTLQALDLSGLELGPVDLLHLPTSLKFLKLSDVGFLNKSREILGRLVNLEQLVFDAGEREVAVDVSTAPALTRVTLYVAAAPQHARLRHVAVREWTETAVATWSECAALEYLALTSERDVPRVTLPAQWVAACPCLQDLKLERVKLFDLPPRLLENATELVRLQLKKCELRSLPDDLLDNTTQLEELDLSDNYLHVLPSDIFNRAWNAFSSLRTALTALRDLKLDGNPLGDLCLYTHDDSPLRNMTGLTKLWLKETEASRVCPEWRQYMPDLTELDLSNNNIVNLTFAELLWNSIDINLEGNPIKRVFISKYNDNTATIGVKIRVDSEIHCDCHSEMLRSNVTANVFEPPLLCGRPLDGQELNTVPLARLQCVDVGGACPAGCRCSRAADRTLTLDCRAATLHTPPRLALSATHPYRDHALHLLLARNRIAALHAADLPRRLRALDLRNNSLTNLDEETLEVMFAPSESRVNLSGNPFDCTCGAAASGLVSTLLRHRRQVEDIESVTCDDGRPLLKAQPRALCWPGVVGLAAGGVALALALVGALAARPRCRRRVVRALRKLGVLRDTEERRYDAFVSFSHRDERFVVEELVVRLERAGHRLCLHYRDWPPGGWIPAQIAASVRASRRTIAVVSAHFLASEWARAEFREAHAAALRSSRPRLLVVLMADPSELLAGRADSANLAAFLATNTYVRRDDPYFWSKLERALPRPSGPRPPELSETHSAPCPSTHSPSRPPTLSEANLLPCPPTHSTPHLPALSESLSAPRPPTLSEARSAPHSPTLSEAYTTTCHPTHSAPRSPALSEAHPHTHTKTYPSVQLAVDPEATLLPDQESPAPIALPPNGRTGLARIFPILSNNNTPKLHSADASCIGVVSVVHI